jgi:hypothetical protein
MSLRGLLEGNIGTKLYFSLVKDDDYINQDFENQKSSLIQITSRNYPLST